jgi:type IV pilus assembly protein PilC
MEKFTYKAKNQESQKLAGIVEASTYQEALNLLHSKGLIVLRLKAKKNSMIAGTLTRFKKVKTKDVSTLTRQLATMIKAGLTLTACLNILQEQAKPAMAVMLNNIVRKIEGGSTFHEALATYPEVFSQVYIALVKSGEAAGQLDKILGQLAETLEKQEAFKRKIVGALIYPALIITGMIAVAFIMMIFVVPQMTEMYADMDATLPLSTQILISISTFMANFWYLIIILVGGGIWLFNRWHKTTVGRHMIDKLVLKIPIIGILLTKVILTQMIRTLSMLIGAGVPIIEALEIVADIAGNVIFSESMYLAAKGVEKGLPLTSSLERFEEYPVLVIQMIAVGEQTGKVGEVLAKVATYFEQESESAIKALTTAIEPLMMVILGVGVGFIVISVITPIYNLTSQF